MDEQGTAPRGRTALALMTAGVLAAGGATAVAVAQQGAYPGGDYPCGEYPGGTYPSGEYPGGGTYPGGEYPAGEGEPCPTTTGGTTTTTTTTTTTGTTTTPGGGTITIIEQGIVPGVAQVRLTLPRNGRLRVPRGGLLTLGSISCAVRTSCPPVTLALGKPRRKGSASAAALPGSYGRKVVALGPGQSQILRLRVKRSAVRTMLRRSNRRLGSRLVISLQSAAPLVRNLTLTR